MNPNKIDLESADEFYHKIKDRLNLTKHESVQLIKLVDEVKFVVQSAKLGPQGHKSAVSIYTKLQKLLDKHRTKKIVRAQPGLFENSQH